MKRTILFLGVLVVLLYGASAAKAVTITYVEQATGTGSLGSNNFTDALVTITFTGDTTNVTQPSPGVFMNAVGTTTVNVAGIGTATFSDIMDAFDNQPYGPPPRRRDRRYNNGVSIGHP